MLLKKLSNPFSLVLCSRISALVVFVVITATSRNYGSLPVLCPKLPLTRKRGLQYKFIRIEKYQNGWIKHKKSEDEGG